MPSLTLMPPLEQDPDDLSYAPRIPVRIDESDNSFDRTYLLVGENVKYPNHTISLGRHAAVCSTQFRDLLPVRQRVGPDWWLGNRKGNISDDDEWLARKRATDMLMELGGRWHVEAYQHPNGPSIRPQLRAIFTLMFPTSDELCMFKGAVASWS